MKELIVEELEMRADHAERKADVMDRRQDVRIDEDYEAKDGEADAEKRSIERLYDKVKTYTSKLGALERQSDGSDESRRRIATLRIKIAKDRMGIAYKRREYKSKFSAEAVLAQTNKKLKDMFDKFA